MAISLIKEEEKHILEVLPLLLKEDEHFRREVAVVLSEVLATKDEFQKVLEEIRLSREESNRRFEKMDRRLDQVDRRLDQVDRRFEKVEQRLEEQGTAITSLTKVVEENSTAIASLTKAVEDNRTAIASLTKAVEENSTAIASLIKTVGKMGMSIRTIGSRWGIEAEVTIRNTLRELLLKNLKVAEVSEWKIRDNKGKVGHPNSDIQVDLLIRNGEHLLIEIKSSADEAHVNRLYKIGELYTEKVGIKPKLLFVAVTMREEGELLCQQLGIQLITYDELEG
ncbi:MAG: DUF3782 domain-containing protein [bacterium]|nr:DUF3782 domain-containing protein [bacterium]